MSKQVSQYRSDIAQEWKLKFMFKKKPDNSKALIRTSVATFHIDRKKPVKHQFKLQCVSLFQAIHRSTSWKQLF